MTYSIHEIPFVNPQPVFLFIVVLRSSTEVARYISTVQIGNRSRALIDQRGVATSVDCEYDFFWKETISLLTFLP